MIVKICGITNAEDAQAAIDAGANALGFNFYVGSPRYVAPEKAAGLMASLPPDVLKVGVFVDRIERIPGLDVAQLHGAFGAANGQRLWRAMRAREDFRIDEIEPAGEEAILLDTPSATLQGGTGQAFDWHLARSLRHRIVVAGGLDGGNVAAAIRTARPWGVDACSRLERAPGLKDPQRVRAFVEAALAAAAELQ